MGCEAEFLAGEKFGGEHDLSGVLAEMLDDVVDGFKDGLVAVLDVDRGGEALGVKGFDDGHGLFDGSAESGGEFGLGDAGGGVELAVALADVGGVADAGDDPLAHVAGEVKEEVADGVFGLVSAEPQLIFVETGDAVIDSVDVFAELGDGVADEDLVEHEDSMVANQGFRASILTVGPERFPWSTCQSDSSSASWYLRMWRS